MNKEIKINYLLPNLFTAASIFVGVVSIINAANGRFERAGWLIVLSLILDGLDGRIARITKGESKFGIEFDSLADIVAFGVAPAMLIYFQIGYKYGKVGVLISALYVVLGAIRLARFNITTSKNDPNVFIGLPIPAAAMFLVSLSLLDLKYNLEIIEPIILSIMLFIAILKVSNIRYFAFKKISIKKAISFKVLILLILVASLLYLATPEVLVTLFSTYILFGIIRAINSIKRVKKFKKR